VFFLPSLFDKDVASHGFLKCAPDLVALPMLTCTWPSKRPPLWGNSIIRKIKIYHMMLSTKVPKFFISE